MLLPALPLLLRPLAARSARCAASLSRSTAGAAHQQEEPGIAAAYQRLLDQRALQPDASQAAAVAALQLLQEQLAARSLDAAASPAAAGGAVPQGAYLWGPVGSGKTRLLDLFLATLPPAAGPPLRLHFHEFILGVHRQLHLLHEALPRVVGRSRAGLPVYR